MKRVLLRGTTALVGAFAIAAGAASVAAADELPVSGALGGYRSPAAGTLELDVAGRATQAPLLDASAAVDGAQVDSAPYCAGCRSAAVRLDVDTTAYPDGTHHLTVTIRDTASRSYTIEKDLEVWNHRPTGSPTATLNIGSAPGTPPQGSVNPGAPGGGVEGAAATSCKSPRLSMFLDQKPLRVSKGVPVLLKNKRYRFTGRLTCVVNDKRKSAAKGTKISLRNTLGRKTVTKPGTKVGSAGKITLHLKYVSSRTIEFRYTGADGKTSKVRIKVRIAQRKG
jgi:hypothetical protein